LVVGSPLASVHCGRAGAEAKRRRNLGPGFVGCILSGDCREEELNGTPQHRATRFEGAGCSAPLAISENGDITTVTKLAESFGELLVRIEGEYREMPGLNLTVTQAERLWGLDRHTCASVLTTLMERRVLKRTTSGTYLQRSSG
jgi:hypothetical protein